ncbi:hypothetical protein ES703_89524 [subsurface metagenome]
MRILILGSGAVGTLLGGLLSYSGSEVFFSGNRENLKVLEKVGLRIQLPGRWLKLSGLKPGAMDREAEALNDQGAGSVPGSPADALSNGADFLFITLKRRHLKTLKPACLAEQPLSAGGKIIFFNCDPADKDKLTPAGAESYLALTLLNAVMLQPGDVELASSRSVLIYEKNRELKRLLSSLKVLGIELYEADHIEPYANSFFLWQLLFLPAAMCQTTYENFLSYPEGREIAARILEEGLNTYLKLKRSLKRLPYMDPQDLLSRIEKGGKGFTAARFRPDRAYNSLLQSILKEKMLENRELNGRLIKMAGQAGVDPLWNWRLNQKLSRVLRVGFYKDPVELYQAIK